MARIVVVTQGALAEELARGADTISGVTGKINTVSLGWEESLAESERKVAAALAEIQTIDDGEEGVLILTDLPGGTPFNVAKKFAKPDRVEVVSGVNLTMLVRLCCPGGDERSPAELADWLAAKGRQSIRRYRAGASESTGPDHG